MIAKSVLDLRRMKGASKITLLTCYDATFARLIADAEVDAVLVGDSLGMVVQGHENTLPVTLDETIYHAKAVARGVRRTAAATRPHLVVDLPFMSYQASSRRALEAAGRLVKEGFAESVKLEGGRRVARSIERMVAAGIPVMGHVGLTPQSVHAFGGFRVQGKEPDRAQEIRDDVKALESAGCYAVVLEGMPTALAAELTRGLSIPTIGIGAGPECDGQVLVIYDLLGMDPTFTPKFVKRYATLHETIRAAVKEFAREVRNGAFPDDAHSFHAGAEPARGRRKG